MRKIRSHIDRLRRKYFGSYVVDDPRPIAEAAPYTYFLPSENELLALRPGDLVKATLRSVPPSPQWDAERMWIEIVLIDGNRLVGELRNVPNDMPQLSFGDTIALHRHDVIDIEWEDGRSIAPPSGPKRRTYWERCLVDSCVLNEGVSIHLLYREQPDMAEEGDAYPDSGWRIRGDYRELSDEEIDAREHEYVAIGKVLNADDSWLPLIDAPVGSAFVRNWETGAFEPERGGMA